MIEKLKIKAVQLIRLEGESEVEDQEYTVRDLEMADLILCAWSHSAPRNGAYNVIEFKVIFEDGEWFEGKYRLRHKSAGIPNLRRYVQHFLTVAAGLNKPKGISKEEYWQIITEQGEEMPTRYKDFLERYEI